MSLLASSSESRSRRTTELTGRDKRWMNKSRWNRAPVE